MRREVVLGSVCGRLSVIYPNIWSGVIFLCGRVALDV